MIKVFISQPTEGKTEEQIVKERKIAFDRVKSIYNEEVGFLESRLKDAPDDAKPLWFLGKSLQLLSMADVAYFVKDWEKHKNCKIANELAKKYFVKHIIEEN